MSATKEKCCKNNQIILFTVICDSVLYPFFLKKVINGYMFVCDSFCIHLDSIWFSFNQSVWIRKRWFLITTLSELEQNLKREEIRRREPYPSLRACPPARRPSSPSRVTCSSSRAGSAIWADASRSVWWHNCSSFLYDIPSTTLPTPKSIISNLSSCLFFSFLCVLIDMRCFYCVTSHFYSKCKYF